MRWEVCYVAAGMLQKVTEDGVGQWREKSWQMLCSELAPTLDPAASSGSAQMSHNSL